MRHALYRLQCGLSVPTVGTELGLHGINAQHMNLALLRRACDPEVDVQVRADMVHQWQQWHGACTACAAAQAAQKLRLWVGKSSWTRPFLQSTMIECGRMRRGHL